jgi:small redox-active disulfide protein 2
MQIKILGPGCPNCQDLEQRVITALSELKLEAEVTNITNFMEVSKNVMVTPGLMINDKVKHSGRPLPRIEQIVNWIKQELVPQA